MGSGQIIEPPGIPTVDRAHVWVWSYAKLSLCVYAVRRSILNGTGDRTFLLFVSTVKEMQICLLMFLIGTKSYLALRRAHVRSFVRCESQCSHLGIDVPH